MRLLTKTTLYFLAALVPFLVGAGFYLYYQFSTELNQRMDEELVTEEIQWIRYLQKETANGATFILRTPEIIIMPVNMEPSRLPSFETTTGIGAMDGSKQSFRQLTHVVPIYNVPYLITIRKSQAQRTALVANITRILLLVFVLLFIVTLGVNWLISRSVWKPFRRSLQKISSAELQQLEAIHFEETSIKEFNELNTALNEMSSKIYRDYVNMKEFTENAAHEMQTPVAIVQGKLELLLQDARLQDDQLEYIMQASEGLTRLSKLNQSLLMLTKIENNQFETKEQISLTAVTEKYLQLFDVHIKDKLLLLDTRFIQDWKINLHPVLADSLVSNLIGNAIKYNVTGGMLTIEIKGNMFAISNSSHLPPIEDVKLFTRFNKPGVHAETSTGLGLAIVKKIVDAHHLHILYNAAEGMHQFIITQKQP